MDQYQSLNEKQKALMTILKSDMEREKLRFRKICIELILKKGDAAAKKLFEKAPEFIDFTMADVDRWIKDPLAAKEEIKGLQAESVKIFRENKSLKAAFKKNK